MPTGRIIADARQTLARIPDGEAGLIVTDPPWDLYGGGIFDACASYDRLSVEDIAAILADARRALVPGGHLYVFATAGPEIVRVATAFQLYGWHFLRLLAWDKCVHSGMGACRNAWEPVFVFSNGKTRGYQTRQTYSSILRARSIPRRTAKPYELYEVFMEMSSKPGELGVDPLLASIAWRSLLLVSSRTDGGPPTNKIRRKRDQQHAAKGRPQHPYDWASKHVEQPNAEKGCEGPCSALDAVKAPTAVCFPRGSKRTVLPNIRPTGLACKQSPRKPSQCAANDNPNHHCCRPGVFRRKDEDNQKQDYKYPRNDRRSRSVKGCVTLGVGRHLQTSMVSGHATCSR